MPGEYNGCVTIQEKKEGTKSGGISFSTRVGIRVIITVPGEFVRKLHNPIVEMVIKDDGNYLFKTSIQNNSTVSIDTNVSVAVKTIFDIIYEEFDTAFPVLRQTQADWNFEVEKPFWGGPYWISTAFAYDSTGDGKNDSVETVPDTYLLVLPDEKAIAIEVGALIAVIVLLILLVRRRNKNKRARRMRRQREERARRKGVDDDGTTR